ALDVIDIHRLPHTWNSKHILQIAAEMIVVRQAAEVALEQAVIGGVETDQRHEQPDIRLGDPVPRQKDAAVVQKLLQFVEHLENLVKSLLVGDLRGRETSAIDAIVEHRIDPIVKPVDLLTQFRRIKIDGWIREIAEAGIHHSQDIGGFI